MENFTGKFKRTSIENHEQLAKAMGVGALLSKFASMGNPTMEISTEGETWTIKRSTKLDSTTFTFKLGEPFDHTGKDGLETSCIFTKDGNKLISVHTAKKEEHKSTKMIREFTSDECIITIEVIGANPPVVCKAVFKRL